MRLRRSNAVTVILLALIAQHAGPVLAAAPASGSAFQLDRAIGPTLERDGVISIERILVRRSRASGEPKEDWVERSLPDQWPRETLGTRDEIEVRAEFVLEDLPRELWAIYLPRLRMNASVTLNGAYLGAGGRFGDNPARNWNRPLYFEAPARLLLAGKNTIDIRMVTTQLSDIRLVAILVGPDGTLRPQYEDRFFRQVTLRGIIVALSLATCVLVGFVAWRRPQIAAAPWFAAVFGCIAFAHSDGVVRDLPVPAALWQRAIASAIVLIAGFTVVGLDRGLGLVRPRLEKIVWIGVALLIVTIAVDPYAFVTISVGLLGVGLAVIAYSAESIVTGIRRHQIRNGTILLCGAAALGGIVSHDLLGGFTGRALPWSPLSQFVPLVMATCAAGLLMSYVLDALSASEALASQLDLRVARIREELNGKHQRLREMEQRQAAADERERIMRDMHDGIGGQIVSALAMVRRGASGADAVLQEALDEMRLLLDSATPTDDLASVLGSLRSRAQKRLSQHGLHLDWRIEELPELPTLRPSGAIQVVRIVQECLNNVIKHANATTVRIAAGLAKTSEGEHAICLEVADDGTGMDVGTGERKPGGIANIRWRAAELGGAAEFESRESGTVVRVWLPIEARDV